MNKIFSLPNKHDKQNPNNISRLQLGSESDFHICQYLRKKMQKWKEL